MSDSVLSHSPESNSNRLDPPHDLMLAGNEGATPWLAMAGRDPVSSNDQLDRQTTELLAYVQQQNDEIDARQAELNARLAQLDNELRTARLRSGLDAGSELVQSAATELESTGTDIDCGIAIDELPPPQSTELPTNPDVPKTAPESPAAPEENISASKLQEFEEVEKIVAQLTSSTLISNHDAPYAIPVEDQVVDLIAEPFDYPEPVELPTEDQTTDDQPRDDLPAEEPLTDVAAAESATHEPHAVEATPEAATPELTEPESSSSKNSVDYRLDDAHAAEDVATEETPRRPTDPFPEMLTGSHLSHIDSGVDIQAMASSLDASEMESERRLLAERKNELDRRKAVLQRMQDETQALHREALEMRLVTEQLWIEISGRAPAEHVTELLKTLRGRLDEEYTAQQQVVDDRRSELTDLKGLIEQKQQDLREQSHKLQEWVEGRHADIKSYAAQVDAREVLLDRREHRMREEFSKWEATRNSYQTQLHGLLKKLNLSGVGE